MGYCGGSQPQPTYHRIGDHSEALQVDFDPALISYAELLGHALTWGGFGGRSWSRQYRSAVFVHSAEQEQAARSLGIREVETLTTWTDAEDYHQKYYLQQSRLAPEFFARFADLRSFIDSHDAMRANAMLAGCVAAETTDEVLTQLEVSDDARRQLRGLARKLGSS